MYKLVNLTGHDIVIKDKAMPKPIVIPSSGKLRARYTTLIMGEVETLHGKIGITKNHYYRMRNMPDPQPGTYFIVSRLVAELYPERDDLLITNGLIKDNGKTIACRSLAKI